MAADQKNQDAKDKIAEGMAEPGKRPEPGTGSGKPGGTGGSQKSGEADEVTEGMAEAGKRPTEPVEDQAERQPSQVHFPATDRRNEMRDVFLAAAALAFLVAAPAWAQQEGELGTGATGGAPGATAGSGTQGGPAPSKAEPEGGTTEGQGVAAQAGKAGTGATGGAPGAPAAPGAEGGCQPAQAGQAPPAPC